MPALLLAAVLALNAPLPEVARAAGVGPLGAWARVATLAAFRFPPTSSWVTAGRDLRLIHGGAPLLFEEEHRITAPAGGRLFARPPDGGRARDLEWTLTPGQSVTFRAGDLIRRLASGSNLTSACRVLRLRAWPGPWAARRTGRDTRDCW
ncbi:MAG: hypothetical protein DMD83_20950 [Candidatus Rokuibacteriota bacterium]|nr:MAG: hypothetical protein DMD83_20950 [Candidatus Rokubacteria bacterium]